MWTENLEMNLAETSPRFTNRAVRERFARNSSDYQWSPMVAENIFDLLLVFYSNEMTAQKSANWQLLVTNGPNISQGSAATDIGCSGIFIKDFITNLLLK